MIKQQFYCIDCNYNCDWDNFKDGTPICPDCDIDLIQDTEKIVTDYTLGELLSFKNNTIKRNAMSILKTLNK